MHRRSPPPRRAAVRRRTRREDLGISATSHTIGLYLSLAAGVGSKRRRGRDGRPVSLSFLLSQEKGCGGNWAASSSLAIAAEGRSPGGGHKRKGGGVSDEARTSAFLKGESGQLRWSEEGGGKKKKEGKKGKKRLVRRTGKTSAHRRVHPFYVYPEMASRKKEKKREGPAAQCSTARGLAGSSR